MVYVVAWAWESGECARNALEHRLRPFSSAGCRNKNLLQGVIQVKRFRTPMLLFFTGILIALVFFGAQLRVPTASATPGQAFSSLNAPATNACTPCHSGTVAPAGSVVITFPSAMVSSSGVISYTPGGPPVPLTVTVKDTTHSQWAFLLTSRLANSITTQAGAFTATDMVNTTIQSNGSINDIAVTQSGLSMSTWSFTWTPPASGAGNVNFYLSGNALNGSTGNNLLSTTMYTLTAPTAALPTITSFTAGAATITAGKSTTLTAVFSGGTGTINGVAGTVTSGTAVTVTPSATTTYTLTDTPTSGTAVTKTATVTVVPAPVITSFTAGATTLTAVFSGGTGTINGVGTVTSGNSVTVTPSATTTYTLTVTNAATTPATATATATVTVNPPAGPVITSFTAGATSIAAGNSTTLTAVFSNGTGSVNNGVGPVISGTAMTVKPSVTTTYTLTVTGTGTPVTNQVTVTVSAATLPPTITSFAAGAASITAGNSTTLTAVFSNGIGTVNNGVGTVTSGTAVTIIPSVTTTYTLTVAGASTSVNAQATVTVNPSTGTGTLAATPSSLSFNYQVGGTLPRHQTLAITSNGGSTSYTAKETDPWLSITPNSGTGTPSSIRASVNPTGMAAGSYGAQINITPQNGKTITVTVALTITGSGGGGGTSGGMFAQTYMYDPTQSGALASAWVDNLGTTPHSTSDPLNQGLVLAKNATAPAGSLTGAVITNVPGSLTELGFDYRDGGQCTATSPRFVVVTTGGTHVVQGCNKVTVPAPTKGWSRVRFNLTDSMQTSPVILPGDSVSSITLVLDQGPGTGSSAAGGLAIIDNIDVNGTFVGKGTTPTPTPTPTPRDD
jgi:hypothetical protein